jgi:hypothetical protein
MNKLFLSLLITGILLTSCTKKQDPFLISAKSIGLLNDSTQVRELKEIFSQDSIVFRTNDLEFIGNKSDIEVFDKTGKHLLVLTPETFQDSTSTIKTIKIIDARFKTIKGLSNASTFGDINNNYKISSIQNTLRNVVVFVNEIDAFFTIDKKELPAELQFNPSVQIEAIQIPEKAKIKYFMIGW